MSILGFLGGLVSPISNAVGKYQDRKRAQEEGRHAHEMATLNQFAGEFGHGRNWLDSLVDGFNRLPRPAIVTMLIYYLYLSWNDPAEFARINGGLATVPDDMWWIIGIVLTFYFGAREFSHMRKSGGFKAAANAALALSHKRAAPVDPAQWLADTYPDVQVKSGVVLKGLNTERMQPAIAAARNLYHAKGVPLVITSALDGKHSANSLHYSGLALDFRTRTLPEGERLPLANALSTALGGDYDVVLEKTHIHVEYDPDEPGGWAH